MPEGLETIGRQTRDNYSKLVGSVKVLVGMGNPRISPSVYAALCQGTPVVIPSWREQYTLDGWNLFEA